MRRYWQFLAGISVTVGPYILLVAAAVLAFGRSVRASFHLDDFSLFTNPLITKKSGLYGMWSPLRLDPVTNLTFWLNYRFGGQDPVGYHVVNLSLHAAVVLLLFYVLQRLIHRNAALVAATIFAVHPIQTEAVAYVSARGVLLGTLFCLISCTQWLRGKRWAAVVMFGAALLTTAQCATYPLVIFFGLLSLSKLSSVHLRPLWVMSGMAVLAGLHAALAMKQAGQLGASSSTFQYFEVQGWAILRYLRLLMIPMGITIDPDVRVDQTWIYLLAWIAIITVTALAWAHVQGLREGFWVIAGLVLLIPSSSIFPNPHLASDHRMYLPLTAFAAVFGLLYMRIAPPAIPVYPPRSLFARTWRAWVAVCLGLALVFLSVAQVETWHTEKSLWTEAKRVSPRNVRPLIQLARISSPIDALDFMIQAKAIDPRNVFVLSQLGLLWLKFGYAEAALSEFGRALAVNPNDPRAFSNRGAALIALHKESAARHDFEAALHIDPCFRAARMNLEQIGGTLPVCSARK